MSDLTMCVGVKDGIDCPMRMHCKRFTDKPSKDYQSYFSIVPLILRGNETTCTWIWDTNNRARG